MEQLKYEAVEKLREQKEEDKEQKIKLLEKTISNLPEKCRTVFLMKKKQGLSYKEISEQLNISEKTVEKHIGRAMEALRKAFRGK